MTKINISQAVCIHILRPLYSSVINVMQNVLWNRAYMPKACHYYAHDGLFIQRRQVKSASI